MAVMCVKSDVGKCIVSMVVQLLVYLMILNCTFENV